MSHIDTLYAAYRTALADLDAAAAARTAIENSTTLPASEWVRARRVAIEAVTAARKRVGAAWETYLLASAAQPEDPAA